MSDEERRDDAATIRMLEDEVTVLRRRLQDAPRRVRLLEERLLDIRNQLDDCVFEIGQRRVFVGAGDQDAVVLARNRIGPHNPVVLRTSALQ